MVQGEQEERVERVDEVVGKGVKGEMGVKGVKGVGGWVEEGEGVTEAMQGEKGAEARRHALEAERLKSRIEVLEQR